MLFNRLLKHAVRKFGSRFPNRKTDNPWIEQSLWCKIVIYAHFYCENLIYALFPRPESFCAINTAIRKVFDFSVSVCAWHLWAAGDHGAPLPQAPPDTQTVKTLSDRPRAPGSWPDISVQASDWSPGPDTGLWLADHGPSLRAGVSSTHLDNWIGHNCGCWSRPGTGLRTIQSSV